MAIFWKELHTWVDHMFFCICIFVILVIEGQDLGSDWTNSWWSLLTGYFSNDISHISETQIFKRSQVCKGRKCVKVASV